VTSIVKDEQALELIMINVLQVGVLLAYIMSMRDIGKLHGKIGLIVEVLKQVC
jgi:hypothetical protein